MTHLPFVACAYALGVAVPLLLGLDALLRGRRARNHVAALERADRRR